MDFKIILNSFSKIDMNIQIKISRYKREDLLQSIAKDK